MTPIVQGGVAAALRKLSRSFGVALRNFRPHPSISQRISEEARRS